MSDILTIFCEQLLAMHINDFLQSNFKYKGWGN